jgi:hypothetical protein
MASGLNGYLSVMPPMDTESHESLHLGPRSQAGMAVGVEYWERGQGEEARTTVKRSSGVLALLVGAPFVSAGIFMAGWGVWGLVFDNDTMVAMFYPPMIVLGFILAASGARLCRAFYRGV